MDRIFVPLYRYFRGHKALMYALLFLSSALFVFFGLKVTYEEDISKLVPSAATENSALAFGNLRVKDKIFIQITSEGAPAETLSEYVDEFIEMLSQKDSANAYVANVLYALDADTAVGAIDFVTTHIPSFVDTCCYPLFDKALDDAEASMERNLATIMEDETGSATQMVVTDPLELRLALLQSLVGRTSSEDKSSRHCEEGEADSSRHCEEGEADPSRHCEEGEVRRGNLPLSDAKAALGASGFTIIDRHFFCADSTVVLAFISPNFVSSDSGSGTGLFAEIQESIDDFTQNHPQAEVYVHGSPIRSVGNSHTIKMDLLMTIGLSLLIIVIVICLSFKSLNILWQQVVPVGYGAFFALACIYLLKGGMSLMALGLGAIVLGVALSYCLHVIVHHRFVGDAEQMLRDESTPVCLGCITTIGAFLGLLFTGSDLLRDFGLFATFALVGNTLFALIFLPHFLKEGAVRKSERAFHVIDRINAYPYDRKPLIISAVAVVIVIGLIFAPKVGFDSDLRNLGYESPRLKSAEKLYADKNLHGKLQRYYAVADSSLDAALEYNRVLSETLDSLRSVGEISSCSRAISILFNSTSLQQQRIDAWNAYWSEAQVDKACAAVAKAASAQGLDPEMFAPFRAMLTAPYQAESLYESGIVPEEMLSNFIEESEGKYLIFNAVQLPEGNRDAVDGLISRKPHSVVVDPFFYTGSMVRIIHEDFSVVLLISSIFVFIVLLLSFRSLLIALTAFMPMFLSWYVVQGVMALSGLQFNLINIVISTFIFGIGVDYSIFVMDGLLAVARGQGSKLLDYHKAAIVFSAFVLLVVVLALLGATHPAISSIGISTLIGMCSTIIITYTLQPLVFRLLMKWDFFRSRVVR